MPKTFAKTLGTLVAVASVITAVPATAQSSWQNGRSYNDGRYRDSDGDGRSDRQEWGRDRDRDGRPDQWDRRDNRRDRGQYYGARNQWRAYGNNYGYDGYRGNWRTGQRYTYYRDSRYYINDWRRYDLPAPRQGYRYYRDRNGDIVMAAIATGVIGLIIGSQLGDNRGRW